ncbi:MAG TPA: hypothetical protein PK233_03190 [Candidatus Atribacteria bacterium]|nr:hypothetical protein [Candidatus Atribacteria bacterium]
MKRKNYLLFIVIVLSLLFATISSGAEEQQEAISLEEAYHNLEIPEFAKVKFRGTVIQSLIEPDPDDQNVKYMIVVALDEKFRNFMVVEVNPKRRPAELEIIEGIGSFADFLTYETALGILKTVPAIAIFPEKDDYWKITE